VTFSVVLLTLAQYGHDRQEKLERATKVADSDPKGMIHGPPVYTTHTCSIYSTRHIHSALNLPNVVDFNLLVHQATNQIFVVSQS